MSGVLYVVATPIGNMGDITVRALETLRTCDRIVAEDTRRTRALLTHFGIAGKPLDSLHAHTASRDVTRIADKLAQGERVAIVTDAGTPLVSDPGAALVREAIRLNVQVVPIPGASSVLAALVGAGLDTKDESGRFYFFGFLPRDGTARAEAIAELADAGDLVVLFESPQRLARTLSDLASAMPNRLAVIARELTKVHEEFVRGTLTEVASLEREWIGEAVIVLGACEPKERFEAVDESAIDQRIDRELAAGAHAKSIAERIAAWSGRAKRDIYERVVSRKQKGDR